MSTYAIINENSIVVDAIEWDGSASIVPPEGTLVLAEEGEVVYVGGSYVSGAATFRFLPEEPAEGSFVYDENENTYVEADVYAYKQTEEYTNAISALPAQLEAEVSHKDALAALMPNRPASMRPE